MEQESLFEMTEEELRRLQLKAKRNHLEFTIDKTKLEITKLEEKIEEKELLIESMQNLLEQLV